MYAVLILDKQNKLSGKFKNVEKCLAKTFEKLSKNRKLQAAGCDYTWNYVIFRTDRSIERSIDTYWKQ